MEPEGIRLSGDKQQINLKMDDNGKLTPEVESGKPKKSKHEKSKKKKKKSIDDEL